MSFLRAIWRDLRTADDFAGDWYKWAGSATMHAAIVGPLLAAPLLWLGASSGAIVIASWLLYGLIWEVWAQRLQKGWVDAGLDTLFVGLGGMIAAEIEVSGYVWFLYLLALFNIATGILVRAK